MIRSEPGVVMIHDFSDRPQFLASVCRVTDATTTCHADSVYAVYSTTPTIDQTRDLFELRGTIRWENISTTVTPQSHFFWEHAAAVAGLAFDTLQIVAKRGLVPDTILSGACGQLVSVTELAYLDTTFVRNSGNFTHALIGEGGVGEPVRGADVLSQADSKLADPFDDQKHRLLHERSDSLTH